MLNEFGHVKLIDFGLCREIETGKVQQTLSVAGSLLYMAPVRLLPALSPIPPEFQLTQIISGSIKLSADAAAAVGADLQRSGRAPHGLVGGGCAGT